MKKLILSLFAIAFLFGCENKSKIEIIPNYESEYYSFKMVESIAIPVNNPQPLPFEEAIKKFHAQESPSEKVYYPVSASIYINEDGKIDKVKIIGGGLSRSVMKKIKERGRINYKNNEDIIRMALPEFEKIKFKPAMLGGKKVKARTDIGAIYVATADGEVGLAESGIAFVKLKSEFETDNTHKETFFVAVEKMPSPIGGIKAIQKNIVYPELAKRAGVQGRVYVKAYIDTNGTVVKTEVIRGIGAGCDEMAMEAVKKVKFTPGRQRGKAVNVQVTVPILYKLDDSVSEVKKSKLKNEMSLMFTKEENQKGLARVDGRIISAEGEIPIAGVNVVLEGTKLGGASNQFGEFFISKVPPGNYKLQINSPKYGKQSMGKIELSSNITLAVELKITEKSNP